GAGVACQCRQLRPAAVRALLTQKVRDAARDGLPIRLCPPKAQQLKYPVRCVRWLRVLQPATRSTDACGDFAAATFGRVGLEPAHGKGSKVEVAGVIR